MDMRLIFCLMLILGGCQSHLEKVIEKQYSLAGGDFVGSWEFLGQDDYGNTQVFRIELFQDGSASDNISGGDSGFWEMVNDNEVIIRWRSGWIVVVTRDEEGNYLKKSYAPGLSLDQKPTHVAKATKIR